MPRFNNANVRRRTLQVAASAGLSEAARKANCYDHWLDQLMLNMMTVTVVKCSKFRVNTFRKFELADCKSCKLKSSKETPISIWVTLRLLDIPVFTFPFDDTPQLKSQPCRRTRKRSRRSRVKKNRSRVTKNRCRPGVKKNHTMIAG